MIQRSISNWIHPGWPTRMYSCGSILRLSSFMLLLARLLNLVDVNTVDITIYHLIVIITHALIKSCKLTAHSTFVSNILALGEIHDIVATFWSSVGVSAVLERYLILSYVYSSTSGIRLCSCSLTVQLLFIMKASIC